MSMFSLLPASLAVLETWLVRLFLLLGLLTIGPWALLILYDFVLFCVRAVAYEVPVVGGRAHGQQRPRAPSWNERPDGEPRQWGNILGLGGGGGGGGGGAPSAEHATGDAIEDEKHK